VGTAVEPNTTTPTVADLQANTALSTAPAGNSNNATPAQATSSPATIAQPTEAVQSTAAAPEQRSVEDVRAQLEKLDEHQISIKVKGVQKHCLLKEYLKEVALDESYPFGDADEFEELVCFETWLKERQPETTPSPLPVSSPVPAPKAPPVVAAPVVAVPAAKAATAPPTRDTRSTTSAALDIRVHGNVLGTTLL
jgi:hypothetical protein